MSVNLFTNEYGYSFDRLLFIQQIVVESWEWEENTLITSGCLDAEV